ncbi:MAG: hypothetical protein JRH19_24240 [Deltaproteobacteria bacterium]|nr:hypothetical protein [Deltaproteobacteria bacterium]
MAHLEIAGSWDGAPLRPEERVHLELGLDGGALEIRVSAPFYRDPAPPAPAGSFDGLWQWEVVELFLLGEDERYLEIELGPHGHYLVLRLQGARRLIEKGLPIEYEVERDAERWRGLARVPSELLPPAIQGGNAYAIHGSGDARRYLALHPVPGPEPDFHRLELFRPLGAFGGPSDAIE